MEHRKRMQAMIRKKSKILTVTALSLLLILFIGFNVIPLTGLAVQPDGTYAVYVWDLATLGPYDDPVPLFYEPDETVTITTPDNISGMKFFQWETRGGAAVVFADAYSQTTTFVMPAGDVHVGTIYQEDAGGGTGGSTGSDVIKFPDPNFDEQIRWIISKPTGDIFQSDIVWITSLDLAGRNISDLTGIEYFTALTELELRNNHLTSLDVSKNTALTHLKVSSNQLTSLDISKNIALTELELRSNHLTALDVSKNTALTQLTVFNNQLTSLNVSANTALTSLGVYKNQLTSIDVSANTALTSLDIADNQLTSLDVSKNTALKGLSVSENQLTSLNVSTNIALTHLSVQNNKLISLDVSKNIELLSLAVTNNQLTSLDVSNNAKLDSLFANYNRLTGVKLNSIAPYYSIDVSRNFIQSKNDITGRDIVWDDILFVFDPQNTIGAIPDSEITDALEQDKPFIKLEDGDSTTISDDALKAIKDQDKVLEIELPNGIVIRIDPDTITDGARSIDLNIDFTITQQATDVNNVRFPANAIILTPVASGEFGFTISFDISADKLKEAGLNGENVRLFYVSSAGVVTELDRIRRNADGSVTISISRASQYVLSDTAPQGGRPSGNVPQTGDNNNIILPLIVLVLSIFCIIGMIFYRGQLKKIMK